MSVNDPFSPSRRRADLVNALPALGLILGAVVGVAVAAVPGAGAGLVAGLLVGLAARLWLRRA